MNNTTAIYPRLLRRVQAVLIDSVLFAAAFVAWLFMLPVLADAHPFLKVMPLIAAFFAIGPLLITLTGGTPGHHMRGLRIQNASTGNRLDILRATLRALLVALLGWLSFILILTTRKHQALHDLIVGSVVVIKEPDKLPASERFKERQVEEPDFQYPSRSRRVLVIFLYLVLTTFMLLLISVPFMSDQCVGGGQCNEVESLIAFATDIILFIVWGAIIVLGWKGMLPGCKRKLLTDESVNPEG